MTDNDIIKALECCSDDEYYCDEDCPFLVCCSQADMAKCSLDLINRQKEENEFLRKTIGENAQRALEVTLEEIENSRVEAITEFTERLKENINKIFDEDNIKYIDNLVKELVGDNND